MEKTLKQGTIRNFARRKLGIGSKQLYALKDETGQITFIRDEVIKVAEKLYKTLYSSNDRKAKDFSM